MKQFLQPVIDWYLSALNVWGVWAVALLMAVESSIVPLPSEVVIPPAAHLAWSGEGLSIFGFSMKGWTAQIAIVIAGAVGSWVGASLMYWVSRAAGRPVLIRFGEKLSRGFFKLMIQKFFNLFLPLSLAEKIAERGIGFLVITPQKIEGAERWASHYGAMGIFAARLLPVVRHLIGIPAGIVRMNFLQYSIYTLIGSGIWSAVLCWLGVKVGDKVSKGEMHQVTFWLVGFLVIVGALYYFFVHRQMKSGGGGNAASEK